MHTRDTLIAEFQDQAIALGLDIDVLMDGPLNAQIAIIGEGPGETETRSGVPFVGGSGKLLFEALRKFNINRANAYVTNVVKRQISLSRKGGEKHVVHRDELERWTGLLKWELAQLPNVRIIFLLGNYALEALTGNTGITNWRGSVLDAILPNGKKGQLVITINPAFAMRELKMEPIFHMDCTKLDMVRRGTFEVHKVEALINPSADEARRFIRDIKKAQKPFSYDIEVINMETACHGLANDPHVAMCINLRTGHEHRFTLTEEADILLDLQDLLDAAMEAQQKRMDELIAPKRARRVTHTSGEGLQLIAQNGDFDAYWSRLHDYLCVTVGFDTLLAHHTLYPQLPHSLAFLTSQYTTHPYYKDEGKFWREGGDIDQFWRYNCTDDAITVAVARRLKRELAEQGLEHFFYSHVMRAQPHLVSATVHGVAIDLKAKARITEQVREDVALLEQEFYRLAQDATKERDYYPNPNSWQQLQVLFFDKLKLQGRGRSTDDANRTRMIESPGTSAVAKEMLTALGRFKEENKFLGTYAESKVGSDGRFRCDYKQYGTQSAPGRLSSTKLLDGQGGNMQNQPGRARGMYIADAGMVFVYFDLAQAEARVVGWRARIERWKEQFEQARVDGVYDAHRALASEMFKVPYDQVPKEDWNEDGTPTIRYIAKRCRHGLNYRMEKWKLAEVTGLPYHEAARAFALYHSATPELRVWWDKTVSDFRKTKTMYNALGRRFRVIQRMDEDVEKSLIAFYPQSTIGDKITQVWYQSEEDDEWPDDARVCIDVHDNLVALASPRTAKTALRILKKHAESPILVQDAWDGRPEPLIIPADLKMSTTRVTHTEVVRGKKQSRIVVDDYHRWSNMEKVTL